MSARVQVEEVAHGGFEVVIRLPVGADQKRAAEIAQEIRHEGWIRLEDPRWSR